MLRTYMSLVIVPFCCTSFFSPSLQHYLVSWWSLRPPCSVFVMVFLSHFIAAVVASVKASLAFFRQMQTLPIATVAIFIVLQKQNWQTAVKRCIVRREARWNATAGGQQKWVKTCANTLKWTLTYKTFAARPLECVCVPASICACCFGCQGNAGASSERPWIAFLQKFYLIWPLSLNEALNQLCMIISIIKWFERVLLLIIIYLFIYYYLHIWCSDVFFFWALEHSSDAQVCNVATVRLHCNVLLAACCFQVNDRKVFLLCQLRDTVGLQQCSIM